MKRITVIAIPFATLAAAQLLLARMPLLPVAQQELVCYAPYLALGVGVALSMAFNRGRVLLALAMLALFYLVARSYLLHPETAAISARGVYLWSSVLIPLNLALFCFMKERGTFSRAGKVRLSVLVAQMLAVYWAARFPQHYGSLTELIARPMPALSFLPGLSLPHWSFFLFLLTGTLVSIRALKRRYPIDIALLGALVACGVTLDRIGADFVPALYVTAAALLLTIGVLQDSHTMAFCDDLTGLPSRRAFNEQMMGLGRRYVVAMLDVDHFKRFNDTYGHQVGDQVLKMVGAKIAAVKGGGKPFRYGGEEFAVVFPRKELKEVTAHLEELRQEIGSYQLWIRGSDRPKEQEAGEKQRGGGAGSGKAVSVTISIGAAASSDKLPTPTEVIKAADKALYRAKQRGRNQVAT